MKYGDEWNNENTTTALETALSKTITETRKQ